MPRNASVSFTLSKAFTKTSLKGTPKSSDNGQVSVSFLFEGKEEPAFAEKIVRLLDSLRSYFPFIGAYTWEINSSNSFPHSTGIASSASSMSALALCLCSVEQQLMGKKQHDADFFRKASNIARLGSGSACRSVYPELALWGQHPGVSDSNDEYAIPMQQRLHPDFRHMRDAILIVSNKEKDVSSRAGHALMEENPFAEARYAQAQAHIEAILKAVTHGDIITFGHIVEKEALTLHALMMSSEPSYLLMKPNTLAIIEKVRQLRGKEGVPVCFTLDAGPNVHLLYPEAAAARVETFIREELLTYCEEGQCIMDQVGQGPEEIT